MITINRCEKCGRIKGASSHECKKPTTIRKNGKSYYEKVCPICNKNFLSTSRKAKTCSYFCNGKMTSQTRSEKYHSLWRGGKGTHSGGYKTVRARKQTYLLEHRVIMENHLKRKLNKGEVVHHINGIKTDNRIENLVVMTHSEHSRYHAKLMHEAKKL